MAVEAARMLKGKFEAVLFASTSSPFKIKQSASFIASALDLDNAFTMDFSNSFRASTNALITANELVDSGKFKRVLVVAADCIPIKPGSLYEQIYGDGAVAIAVEKEGAAKIIGYNSSYQPLPGAWMLKDELISFDARLDAIFGYASNIQRSAMSLLGKLGMSPMDFDRIVASAPDPKSYESLLKAVGAKPQEFFFKNVGILGTAHPMLLLASQLDRTGRILLGSYGEVNKIARLAPLSVRAIKEAARAYRNVFGFAIEKSLHEIIELIPTQDFAEGMKAFVQRRRPSWSGK